MKELKEKRHISKIKQIIEKIYIRRKETYPKISFIIFNLYTYALQYY